MGFGDWAQSPIPNPQSPCKLKTFKRKYKINFYYINKLLFDDLFLIYLNI